MKNKMQQASVITLMLLSGCVSPRIEKVWQPENFQTVSFNKILIAAIPFEKNDTLRSRIEKQTENYFAYYGIDAVSTLTEFGPDAFRFFSEETAYKALCERGIDAVFTIAQVEPSKNTDLRKGIGKKYSSAYYYNHLWNYRNLRNDTLPESPTKSHFFLECILFDLNTLEARSVMQVYLSDGDYNQQTNDLPIKDIIKKLITEKVIKSKDKQNIPPRPF